MLVYGERWRETSPEALLLEIEAALHRAAGAWGLARHELLTEALILAGELAQGLADAGFAQRGCDEAGPVETASLEACIAIAAAMLTGADPRTAIPRLSALRGVRLAPAIRCKTPEGFAFYAVHPESYANAASAQSWLTPPLILGLRSIGTTLAAMVAARTGGPAVTLRPCGHPFHRELRLCAALRDRLARHSGAFAVVDEGPGLSGSSFAAAGALLEGLGVGPDRIVLMPSHGGAPGPQASANLQARWAASMRRPAASLVSPEAVARWFADATGPLTLIEDISGGAWRNDLAEAERPPAAPANERLKFRLTAAEGRYVARFAGIGRSGEEKLRVALRLHAAGWTPEPLALRRGFLLERWVEGRAVRAADLRQPALLAQVARYLAFRARELPARPEDGAAWPELREMARTNATELGGAGLRDRVEARLAGVRDPATQRFVRIDGRLHPWEWRMLSDGTLHKTDALDHAVAHDLVGCQDIAWDVAGAAVEFGLSPHETERLRAHIATLAQREVDPDWVEAFRLCYAAFQAGLWDMAAAATPEKRARAAIARDRYAAVLRAG